MNFTCIYYVKRQPIQPESINQRRTQIFCNFVCMYYVQGLLIMLRPDSTKGSVAQIFSNFVYVLCERTPCMVIPTNAYLQILQ